MKNTSDSAVKSERVRELQQKIYDRAYLDNAIQRIALVLSRKLVENREIIRT
ncbi:hypothetical protein [Treponema brennaborense]|nr:hypothetical protein [Treponema brennaborense]